MTTKDVIWRGASKRFFLERAYALGYVALSTSGDEEKYLGRAIRRTLGKDPISNGRLLDIGCADARLTRAILTPFKHVTLYEPNPLLFSLATSNLEDCGKTIEARNREFPDPAPPDETFDVILASHMLYHVHRDQWAGYFRAAIKLLKRRGLLMLVLWNKHSEARAFAETIDPSRWVCCAEDLTDPSSAILKQVGLSITTIERTHPFIKVFSLEMAKVVTDFLLGHARRTRKSDQTRIAQFEKKLLVGGIGNSQSIIVLRRSGE